MTRFPFGSEELGRTDPELDRIAARLEGYAEQTRQAPPPALVARIMSAVDAEPERPVGAWARLTTALVGLRRPAQALAVAAVLVAAVVGALALAEIADRARTDGFGSSPTSLPSPTVISSPTPTPTPTPSPRPTPSPTPSPSATGSPTPAAPPSLAETPEPSDDHGSHDTPEPSSSDDHGGDHSGSGGGED